MIAYWMMKLISKIICIFPRYACHLVASVLGYIAWLVVPQWRKQMAVSNIRECLGVDEARAEAIAHASVSRFGRMLVEVLRFPLLTTTNFRNLVAIEGEEYLEEAYHQGRGVIMATGHFGNWEMLGASMALMGYPILSISRKQNNGGMDKFINEYRELVGQKMVYNHGSSSMMAINRILRDKNMLGVLYDQDTGNDGTALKLFGKPAVVPSGAAVLSRIHKAAILPLFMHNNDDGTLKMKIYPPIYTAKTQDKNADIDDVMKQLVVVLEQEIIANPTMWFWVHDRWKDGKKKFKQ